MVGLVSWIDVPEIARADEAVADVLREHPGLLCHREASTGETIAHVAARRGLRTVLSVIAEISPAILATGDLLGATPEDVAGVEMAGYIRQLGRYM